MDIDPNAGLLPVIGIDPGNDYTGLSRLMHYSKHPLGAVLLDLHAIRIGEDPWSRVLERVHPLVVGWCAQGIAGIGVEKTPPTARRDVNHGGQAAVGWAQGFTACLCCFGSPLRPLTPMPSEWRDTMFEVSGNAGFRMYKPTRASVQRAARGSRITGSMVRDVVPMGEGLYRVAYKGCDHGHIVSGYAHLRSAPTSCPRCAMEATAKVSMDPAQMVRDEWKRIACLFVRHFYPEKYDQLVSEARGRARNQEKPDHHLAGVSDACESVGVALHVLRGVR